MKRLLTIFVLMAILLCGCGGQETKETKKDRFLKGVWFSFTEINAMLEDDRGFEAAVDEAVQNCKTLEIDHAYIHIRSYCDSLFNSDYFPIIDSASNYQHDAFKYMLEAFHKEDIKVHAWINPYRVLTGSDDINELRAASPAYKWLKDDIKENDINVCFSNGIYLNPASAEVRALVINGVREVMEKYSVDGIHFDDYFYPTTDSAFDLESYEEYKSNTAKPLSLGQWRRTNVNTLISSCKSAIEFSNKSIEFSISPAASTEDNYNNLYADVELWVKNGYIDSVIPQIYFGFDYPIDEYKFENLLSEWKKIADLNNEVDLIIGLGNYKIGTDSEPDKLEWQSEDDIIARQVKVCYDDEKVSGCAFFSYSSLFSDNELNFKQRENLIEILKEKRGK